MLALREALKTSRDRASELERDLGAKSAELATASMTIDKAREEARVTKQQLEDKTASAVSLRETGEALLQQLAALKDELVSVKAVREEERTRAAREVEKAKAAVEAERSNKLADLEESRAADRKSKKTITMYEVLTADQQAKIKALSDALDGYAETKKELASYVSNGDALAKAAQTSQEVCSRLEKELASAYQQVSVVESERAAAATEARASEARLAEEIESLATAKRHSAAVVAQLTSDKEVLQLRIDTLVD
jgi:hypothetical protein